MAVHPCQIRQPCFFLRGVLAERFSIEHMVHGGARAASGRLDEALRAQSLDGGEHSGFRKTTCPREFSGAHDKLSFYSFSIVAHRDACQCPKDEGNPRLASECLHEPREPSMSHVPGCERMLALARHEVFQQASRVGPVLPELVVIRLEKGRQAVRLSESYARLDSFPRFGGICMRNPRTGTSFTHLPTPRHPKTCIGSKQTVSPWRDHGPLPPHRPVPNRLLSRRQPLRASRIPLR